MCSGCPFVSWFFSPFFAFLPGVAFQSPGLRALKEGMVGVEALRDSNLRPEIKSFPDDTSQAALDILTEIVDFSSVFACICKKQGDKQNDYCLLSLNIG